MNTTPKPQPKGVLLRPSFTPSALLYTISRHSYGMNQEDAGRFVDACTHKSREKYDHTPEAA